MLIKLNVGGQLFWTSRETLMSQGPHMLSAMVQHDNPGRLIEGAYFIDRDPNAFRWILNYLRGSKTLPNRYMYISSDQTTKIMNPEFLSLREEAEYFAIENLLSRIQHMICPSFSKGDAILVRGSKFTILNVEETGYVVTRLGKSFRIDASENVEPTRVEAGDVIMAWHRPSNKRMPGICMALEGRNVTVQFNGDLGQEGCNESGVRF